MQYIDLDESCYTFQKVPIPWMQIITSVPFWSLIVFSFGNTYGYNCLMTEIPTYLSKVQHLDMAQVGEDEMKWYSEFLSSFQHMYSAANKLNYSVRVVFYPPYRTWLC